MKQEDWDKVHSYIAAHQESAQPPEWAMKAAKAWHLEPGYSGVEPLAKFLEARFGALVRAAEWLLETGKLRTYEDGAWQLRDALEQAKR